MVRECCHAYVCKYEKNIPCGSRVLNIFTNKPYFEAREKRILEIESSQQVSIREYGRTDGQTDGLTEGL